ncbi:MAG: hypothetical protein Ct9H300mP20_06460 [Gammaproteobacteria bacterium]|nr:MAG: hypothetical protein Ct9H300mP20_06460 [Gammaproteobacteria bacterium]
MNTSFSITRLHKTFGVIVEGLKLSDLNNSQTDELYKLWLEHHLLIFPNQHLSHEEQIKFAKLFGEMEFDITPISNVRKDGSIRDPVDDDVVKSFKRKYGMASRQHLYAHSSKRFSFYSSSGPSKRG